MPLGPQAAGQVGDFGIGFLEGFQFGQLAADVDVDPHDLQAGQTRGFGVDFAGAGNRDAELVFLLAGGDLFMRPGVHVRVDSDGDRGGHAKADRNLGQRPHFGFGFHVELPDAAGQGQPHLVAGLADAGKDDAIPRNPGGLGAQVFAGGNDVHPGTKVAKGFQDGDVGQGFDGKADKVRQGA